MNKIFLVLAMLYSFLLIGCSESGKKTVAIEASQIEAEQNALVGRWYFVSATNSKGKETHDPSEMELGLDEITPFLMLFENGKGKIRFSSASVDAKTGKFESSFGYTDIAYKLIDNEIKIGAEGNQPKLGIKYESDNNGRIILSLAQKKIVLTLKKGTETSQTEPEQNSLVGQWYFVSETDYEGKENHDGSEMGADVNTPLFIFFDHGKGKIRVVNTRSNGEKKSSDQDVKYELIGNKIKFYQGGYKYNAYYSLKYELENNGNIMKAFAPNQRIIILKKTSLDNR